MKTVKVCCGTGCLANGSMAVAEALEQAIAKTGAEAQVQCAVKRTGCFGLCESGPLVTILPDNIAYYRVRPLDAEEIVQKTLLAGEIIRRKQERDRK